VQGSCRLGVLLVVRVVTVSVSLCLGPQTVKVLVFVERQ